MSYRERQGLVPGSIDVGESQFVITQYDFDQETYSVTSPSLENIINDKYPSSEKIRILIFRNYMSETLLNTLRDNYDIHALTLEDIAHTDQRSKYESYANYDLCVINKFENKVKCQISLILTENNTILLFQEGNDIDSSTEKVLTRIAEKKGRIREKDSGYIAYAILDSIVDSYFLRLEEYETIIDILDEKIENEQSNETASSLFDLKREILHFKKNIWPLRECINSLRRNEKSFFFKDESNKLFFRDLQDHVYRITENTDAVRDSVYSLVEMHMNFIGMKMNEIMKILTMITTIFVPITFITSVYGMNFEGIRETHWKYGYELFWFVAIAISVFQYTFFKRRKWL